MFINNVRIFRERDTKKGKVNDIRAYTGVRTKYDIVTASAEEKVPCREKRKHVVFHFESNTLLR